MEIFLPVFKALSENKIRYVTVGGVATILHGFARITGDIDLVLDLSKDNCIAALNVFSSLKFKPRVPVNILDFADESIRKSWIDEKGMMVFSLYSTNGYPLEIDIFVKEPMPFNELYERSKIIEIEDYAVRIASIDDIITLKRRASRPDDLSDIKALELIKADGKE